MAALQEGDYAWLQSPDKGFVPCRVEQIKKKYAAVKLLSECGDDIKDDLTIDFDKIPLTEEVDLKSLTLMNRESLRFIPDMARMNDLTTASILHNLRICFIENRVYVAIGTVLVSVNPFQELPIYSPQTMDKYKHDEHSGGMPHIYGLAARILRNMTETQKSQSCLVSGESGAGKTMTVKHFMQYLAVQSDSSGEGEAQMLQQRIVQCNPLLESFGNAGTIKNRNSSRFGKWTQINYNIKKGTISGGSIINYLLEKSRVVIQSANERNYHVFYQLLKGVKTDPRRRSMLYLGDYDENRFNYLSSGSDKDRKLYNDKAGWENLCQAMGIFSIDDNETDEVLKVVAAILHLGNIEFLPDPSDDSRSILKDEKIPQISLKAAAKLLGMPAERLDLTFRQQTIRSANNESIIRSHTAKQAEEARDVFAKTLYGKLFDWLVIQINECLLNIGGDSEPLAETTYIGVLDIFGFETLEINSFEQLCVNYCNEKLQYYFNDHIFSLEQTIYKEEGVPLDKIQYIDNKKQIKMIEDSRGLFGMIDDEIRLPRGNDRAFLDKFFKKYEGGELLQERDKLKKSVFTIVHYAGPVEYDVTGFIKKNKDLMYDDLESLIENSTSNFVRDLHTVEEDTLEQRERAFSNLSEHSDTQESALNRVQMNTNRRASARRASARRASVQPGIRERGLSTIDNISAHRRRNLKSLGTQFKQRLSELLEDLNDTEPNFVRCIKPNNNSSPNEIDNDMILKQLEYSGILQVCKIRKYGFPVRKTFEEFTTRYLKMLVPNDKKRNLVESCIYLQSRKKPLLLEGEWVIGKTKVFLKEAAKDRLDNAWIAEAEPAAIRIQAFARGSLQKQRYKLYKVICEDLRKAVEKQDLTLLVKSLTMAGELPHDGVHRTEVREAAALRRKLEEVAILKNQIEKALIEENEDALQNYLSTAEEMEVDMNDNILKRARKMIEQLQKKRDVESELINALKNPDQKVISTLIEKARDIGLTKDNSTHLARAMALKTRFIKVNGAVAALDKAMKSRNVAGIRKAVVAMNELGEITHAKVLEAQKIAEIEVTKSKEREQKINSITTAMQKAIEAKDLIALKKESELATELGIDNDVVKQGLALLERLKAKEDYLHKLKATTERIHLQQSGATGALGLTQRDIDELDQAIFWNPSGLSQDDVKDEKAVALKLKNDVEEQLKIQDELIPLLNTRSPDIAALRALLDKAGRIGFVTDMIQEAAKYVRDAEASALDGSDEVYQQAFKANAELSLDEKLERAKFPQYSFKNYFLIREDGDYARGNLKKKSRIIENKLKYQNTVIPRSVLSLDDKLSKIAIQMNKNLLGYCNDLLMGFPARLAEENFIKVIQKKQLVDEMYIQVIKHLTENTSKSSEGRAWQYMALLASTIAPSPEFDLYVLNFLYKRESEGGLWGVFAHYSIRRMLEFLSYKNHPPPSNIQPPDYEEITAYQYRMPAVITAKIADGTVIVDNLPISPDTNVGKVLQLVKKFFKMTEARANMLGLYLQDDHDPDFPIPLTDSEYLGDLVRRDLNKLSFTLILKRKFYIENEPTRPSGDLYFDRLNYLQALHEYKVGNWRARSEDTVAHLSALAMAVQLINHPDDEINVVDFLPKYLASRYSGEEWDDKIDPFLEPELKANNALQSQSRFLTILSRETLFGSSLFRVYKTVEEPTEKGKPSQKRAKDMRRTASRRRSKKKSTRLHGIPLGTRKSVSMMPKDSIERLMSDYRGKEDRFICAVNHRGLFVFSDDEDRHRLLHLLHESITHIKATLHELVLYHNSNGNRREVVVFNTKDAKALSYFLDDYKFLNESVKGIRRSIHSEKKN